MDPSEVSGMEALRDAPIPCHELDLAGVVRFVNPAECRLLECEPSALVGRPVWELVAPHERERSREAVLAKLAGERLVRPFERRYVRPSGGELALLIQETLLRGPDGRIRGMRSFLFDITAQRRAEERLRESERRSRQLLERASDIILRADMAGRLTYCNASAASLLGYRAGDLIGKRLVRLVRKDWRREVLAFYGRQFRENAAHTYFEFPVVAHDGRTVWLGQNLELVVERGRRHVEGVTRDITAQRLAHEEQACACRELEKRVQERTAALQLANEFLQREIEERREAEEESRRLEAQVQHTQRLESLGVLAGGIAHDFNNLLASIMGYASLALDDAPPGTRVRTALEEVLRASHAAAELTSQMLAYSGKGQLAMQAVDLAGLVRGMVRLMAPLLSKKAVLQLDLPDALPAVRGDAGQMRQIVLNLATNASDALDGASGAIRIAARQVEVPAGARPAMTPGSWLPPGDYIELSVSDTGCGMDELTVSRIFDPFFTTKFAGRGLGLAAVAGIVRAHRGLIEVESARGAGSCFRVLLPGCAEAACTAGDEPSEEPAYEWTAGGLILVVDDDRGVRELACRILEASGLDVACAADGHEAVEQFARCAAQVRAVVLDLTMPGMDGSEVYRRISETRPGIPTVVCSGYDSEDFHSRFEAEPPPVFLRKPYLPGQLLAALRRALGD